MKTEEILTLIQAVSDSSLQTFVLEEGTQKICLSKQAQTVEKKEKEIAQTTQVQTLLKQTEKETSKTTTSEKIICSPLVGVFYTSPQEGADPYIQVGQSIKKGQVVGIVEAMKLMNEIESEYEGVVEEIFVKNEQMVEYGQPLVRVR